MNKPRSPQEQMRKERKKFEARNKKKLKVGDKVLAEEKEEKKLFDDPITEEGTGVILPE